MSVIGVIYHPDNRYFVEGYILKGIATSGECADFETVAIGIDQGAIGSHHLIVDLVAPLQSSLLVADTHSVEATERADIIVTKFIKTLCHRSKLSRLPSTTNIAREEFTIDIGQRKIAIRARPESHLTTYASQHKSAAENLNLAIDG